MHTSSSNFLIKPFCRPTEVIQGAHTLTHGRRVRRGKVYFCLSDHISLAQYAIHPFIPFAEVFIIPGCFQEHYFSSLSKG